MLAVAVGFINTVNMQDRLHFNLLQAASAGHRLAIEVPRSLMDSIHGDDVAAQNLAMLAKKKRRYVVIESGEASDRLLFNDKRIGDAANKTNLLKNALRLITDLNERATESQKDLTFQASMVQDAQMTIAWPQLHETQTLRAACRYMADIAHKLHHGNPDSSYAYVARHDGVRLHANNAVSKSFETNRVDYSSLAPTFTVVAQAEYEPAEKFICLVGGLAIARADGLASA